MSRMLLGSIDLNKIDKTKIITKDKEGKPFQNGAKYLPVVVWVNDAPDNYGNHASIQQGMTKEERDSNAKPTYLGNLKELERQHAPTQQYENSGAVERKDEDDLPF